MLFAYVIYNERKWNTDNTYWITSDAAFLLDEPGYEIRISIFYKRLYINLDPNLANFRK